MSNKFLDIVSSPLMNLENVYRYSGIKMVEPESLAIHTLEVQILGYLVIDHINYHSDENLDKLVFLEKALHHDLEESLTGDVARPLKYNNKNVLRELRDVANNIAKDLYEEYFCDSDKMYDIWESAKDDKEGIILKVVDSLTVASKAIKEVEMLNNKYFLRVAYEVRFYLKEIIDHLQNTFNIFSNMYTVAYLVSLLDDAISALNHILEQHESMLKVYQIAEKSLVNK